MYSGEQPGFTARNRLLPVPGFFVDLLISNLHIYCTHIKRIRQWENRLDGNFFCAYNSGMAGKRGRPPKPPGEGRETRLYVRLSADEKEAVEAAAARAGVSLSDWIRRKLNTASRRSGRMK